MSSPSKMILVATHDLELVSSKAPKPYVPKEPTIDLEDIGDRAEEVIGDKLVKITQRDRVRRSEKITIHFADKCTLSFTHNSYRDPDAVRRAVLKWLDDVEQGRRQIVGAAGSAESIEAGP